MTIFGLIIASASAAIHEATSAQSCFTIGRIEMNADQMQLEVQDTPPSSPFAFNGEVLDSAGRAAEECVPEHGAVEDTQLFSARPAKNMISASI